MAKFFERKSLFTPKHVEYEVSGNQLRFYPVSLTMLWKMRTAFEPILDAFRILSGGKNDFEQIVDQGADEFGNQRTITKIGSVDIEIAKMREQNGAKAVKLAMEAVFSTDTRDLLGELITDSLRDEFTREEAVDRDVVQQVVRELNLETMMGMAMGLVNANAKVFGPFAEKVRKTANQKLNEVLGTESDEARTASTDEALAVGRDPASSAPNQSSAN